MERAEILANVRCPCGSGELFAQCCQAKDIDLDALRTNTVVALRSAGVAPEFVYAYERTGLIVVATYRHLFSAADLDEWDDAVAEYRENHPGN
ncbi:MAG TPA: SEC-C domain-containing protein [Kofleriaceae bacterium]|nr:SEC-C domain-containing protein [Kofleriaceae bacterium]